MQGNQPKQHWWNGSSTGNNTSGAPKQHFWNKSNKNQANQAHDWNGNGNTYDEGYGDGYYNHSNPSAYPAPMYEPGAFVQGPAHWEHQGYANGGYPANSSGKKGRMTHREKNMYSTPFGTPGFASENLLADNPWTHDTLGYDYYDYYADQRVRGPFGVAPGSVVPPSQRPFINNSNNNMNSYEQPKRGGFFHKNKGGQGTGNTNARGLNKGVIPPGAQIAYSNQPITSDRFTDVREEQLDNGGFERIETEVVQTIQQDVVYGGRGANATRSRMGNTRNPSMDPRLPMNIPSAATTSVTTVVDRVDGVTVPISDPNLADRKVESFVNAENPTTGLPLNSATGSKSAK